MFDPNTSPDMPLTTGHMDAMHIAMWEDSMAMAPSLDDTELLEPYGAEQMIGVSPDMAVGMLACIYGLNTQVDDSPDGATNSDDNYTLLEGRYTQDQVDSLF
jgi:hypothetical protein